MKCYQIQSIIDVRLRFSVNALILAHARTGDSLIYCWQKFKISLDFSSSHDQFKYKSNGWIVTLYSTDIFVQIVLHIWTTEHLNVTGKDCVVCSMSRPDVVQTLKNRFQTKLSSQYQCFALPNQHSIHTNCKKMNSKWNPLPLNVKFSIRTYVVCTIAHIEW